MRQHYHRCMVCGEIAAHSNHTALTCLSCLEAGLKYCNVCGRVLPLEAFTKKRDKYASDCLECHRGLNSPAYQENRRRAEAIRRKDPAYRDRKNALNRLHYHSSSAPSAQAAYWANKNHARRARLQGSFTEKDVRDSFAFFNDSCAYCGATGKLTVDHIIPVSRFGANKRYNIVPACTRCNSSKCDHDIIEWYQKQPFYSVERLLKIHSWFKDQQGGGI